ncbi:unnamed protein product [Zymoseptoria tritici ST99CH_3D1]|nr:unnamed protein product [Zymoseptoria tritici ST99CH_3D1]
MSADDSHKMRPGMFSQSQGTNKSLLEKVARLDKDLAALKDKSKDLDRALKQKDATISARNARISELEGINNSAHGRSEKEKNILREQIKTQKMKSDSELAAVKRLPDLVRAYSIQGLQAENSELKSQLQKEQKLHAEQTVSLNALMSQQKIAYKDTINARDKDITQLNEANKDLHNAYSSLYERERKLKKEVDGRTSRKADRATYAQYRGMYKELDDATGDTLQIAHSAMSRITTEENLWRKSREAFDKSEKLTFLRQANKFPGIFKAIGEYLDAQAGNANKAGEAMAGLRQQLQDDFSEMKRATHFHRWLVRHHFIEEHHNAFDNVDLAHALMIEPFRRQRKALAREKDEAAKKLIGAGEAHRGRLSVEKDEIDRAYRSVNLVLNVLENVRRLSAFESLLGDHPWEKAVFVETLNMDNTVRGVSNYLNDGEDLDRERRELLDEVNRARDAQNALEAKLRERFVLEYDSGLLTEAQQKSNDNIIKQCIAEHRSRLHDALESLGLAIQQQRKRRSLSLPLPAVQARTPVPTAKRSASLPRKRVRASKSFKPSQTMQAEHRALAFDIEAMPASSFWSVEPSLEEVWSGNGERATRSGGVEAIPMFTDAFSRFAAASGNNAAADVESNNAQEQKSAEGSNQSLEVSPNTITSVTPASAAEMDDSSPSEPDTNTEEPQTILTYQMSADTHRSAAMASRNTDAAYWHHKLYKGPEGDTPKVLYCSKFEVSEKRAQLFLNEPILGFDIEWEPGANDKSGAKKNVSLIQLAAGDKIGLFHVAYFDGKSVEQLMPPTLRKILEDPNVTKAGVNIGGDATRMRKWLDVDMKGVFELSHLFRIVKHEGGVNFKPVSMAKQVQTILHLPIKKDDVRMSDWSRPLNVEQTHYAAADAYAGFMLYHTLDNERKLMKPKPPLPAFYETGGPLVLGTGEMIHKGGKRTAGPVVTVDASAAGEIEQEGEEFYDALDALDHLDLNSGIASELIGPSASLAAASTLNVDYPSLPAISSSASEHDALPSNEAQPIPSFAPSKREKATAAPLPKSTPAKNNPLPCPENQRADTWIRTRRAESAADLKRPASDSVMRAYHLWHVQHFELNEVARFCRDPPLTMNTVASYVMDAIEKENLPFEQDRLKQAASVLPTAVQRRYRHLLRDV